MAFGFKRRLGRQGLKPKQELKATEALPHPKAFVTMVDVIRANNSLGERFFDEPGHRLESGLLKGKYFITSEVVGPQGGRVYRVHKALKDGAIQTWQANGGDMHYLSKIEARMAILEHVEVKA